MKNESLLYLKGVSKYYYSKGNISSGISKINVEFNLGEFVVITGESGSGKSTLLNVLAGLDSYEEGEMFILGNETSHYGENDFEKYRKTYIGHVFQTFNLVNSYTVYQNIELSLLLNGFKKKDIKSKVNELIEVVGLKKFKNTKVSKLSGGQKQRVSIARALAKDTPIIIADEPTGNLDAKSAEGIMKLFSDISKEKLVIIVTHNYEQAEKYATRKIEMHDGKIREDIVIREIDTCKPITYDFDDINFFSKFSIAWRNTFNIFGKFVLELSVFLFVIIAFLFTYSKFRVLEYNESLDGYNNYFSNFDNSRIILRKNDKSVFNDSDLKKISDLKDVNYIFKDDSILDSFFELTNIKHYFSGYVSSINLINKVDVGRLPQTENEVVIKGYRDDYDLTENIDDIFAQKYNLNNHVNGMLASDIRIVGIIYDDSYNYTIYLNDSIFNKAVINNLALSSDTDVLINDKSYRIDIWNSYLNIIPSSNVLDSEAVISKNDTYLCKNNCYGEQININVKNIYFENKLNLTIKNIYNKYNFGEYSNLKYDDNNEVIFISENDYKKLYDNGVYQISVYVKDDLNLNSAKDSLNKMGYKTLALKDTSVDDSITGAVVRILRLIVIVILFIVMFFISYFVIKLIQKSKNYYYSIVRILGGSVSVVNSFIRMELLNIFHIGYIIVVGIMILSSLKIINNSFINNITDFLSFKDYILIYLILLVMCLLIAFRYSRKLFKKSAMKSLREEV